MMRKPLGRGLDALIGNFSGALADSAPSNPTENFPGNGGLMMMIPVGQIVPGKYQPRLNFTKERMEELKRAIQSQGIIEPLIARRIEPGEDTTPRYELVAGERRLRAAREVGFEAVPVVVRELDDRAALEMALVENLAREELSAIEEGIAFKRLHKHFEQSHDEIAERVGKSRPYVSNTIRLLELPQEVIELIAGGQLSAGQARPLLSIGTSEGQIAAARGIVAGRISARGAEQIGAAVRAGRAPSSRERENLEGDPNENALAESMQRALKRKVRIVRARGNSAGRIEIEYYDDNDLTALAETIAGRGRDGVHA
ncbi:MAG: ParB/RepB/Spo0J family partition protein [Candidatus Binatus sp.]|uniref:ParB/RepB/Spo0J family partition protein n=1 Tax=Candidatus Binatus sp. TaxID=2811406 RepID=UPI00271A82AC|nr:ParB/RepB/Spo0J family partition protein [Candidatus Binatus sp.]MDO8433203.1 ParB/RepB/Spo0J family partition protein [Candidatus Binatus sp.]